MTAPDRKPEPYLHVRSVDGLLFELATAVTGNRAALLRLKEQIERALEGRDGDVPFEEEVYRDVNGQPFEVAVKLARRREEMGEPVPRPEKTPEKIPWAEISRGSAEERERRQER